MWHEDEQHDKYDKAKSMVGTRLCVYCRARQVDEDHQRENGADLRGRHWTFEKSYDD